VKAKELEALAEAVQTENYRKRALDAQRGYRSSNFPNVGDQATNFLELDKEGLDWDRIAEKMSTVSMTTRTARECEIRWLGDQHPEFNHEPWSTDEVTKVKLLVAECQHSPPDWVSIAEQLGTKRTPLDCMRHGTTRRTHQWTADSDGRLLQAIRMYGHNNWHLVARYVSEDATPSQCSSRFQRTIDPSITHANWTPEEDSRLRVAVTAYGSSWVDIAAVLPGRHNDQCRDRWTEQVHPAVNRSKWTEVEDGILLDHIHEHEDASWKEIAEQVGNGRTENMVDPHSKCPHDC
ncbi:Homeodomain-like protein, partial [Melanogaster broomeanus]